MSTEKKQRRVLGEYTYPTWIRILECLGIVGYLIVAAITSLGTARGAVMMWGGEMQTTWLSVLAFFTLPVLAYVMADFMSGFVHCCADNFGEEDTFFFGPAFIKPFREHHRDPAGITHHDFIEVNGNSCLANLFVLVPAYLYLPFETSAWGVVGGSFALFFTFSIVFTNQFHKWAHTAAPSALARLLQSWHLVLTPKMHQVHHTPPFERYYCITSGWMNPFLEKVGFFDWLTTTFEWAKPSNLPKTTYPVDSSGERRQYY